jgi:hypothetical protein
MSDGIEIGGPRDTARRSDQGMRDGNLRMISDIGSVECMDGAKNRGT